MTTLGREYKAKAEEQKNNDSIAVNDAPASPASNNETITKD